VKEKDKRVFLALPALAGLVWVVFIFFQYINNHYTYTLFFKLFDTAIPQIFLMGAIALLAYCLGRTILVRLLNIPSEPDTDFIFSSAVGFMILSLGMGIITFSHLLTRTVVYVFLAALVLISLKEIVAILKRIRLPEVKFSSHADALLFFFILVIAGANLLFALAPPFGLDEQQYHLTAPVNYIKNGGFYVMKNLGGQSRYPQNTEMLITLALILKDDILAKLVNYYFGILALFVIRGLTRRFFSFGSLLPSAIFYCSWLVYYISAQIHVELPLTFFEGVALFSLLLWLERKPGETVNTHPRKSFFFYFSATCAGFGMGIKYTFILSVISLVALLIFYNLFILREEIKKSLRQAALFIVTALVIFSPWLIKNTICYNNPLEPFQTKRLLAYFTSFAGKKTLPADSSKSSLVRRAEILNRAVYPKSSHEEFLLIPYNATIYGDWGRQVFDMLVSPFYLMFLPFIFFIKKKGHITNAVLLYVIIFYIQWAFLQPITRYLVSVMPFMAILIAFILHRLGEKQDVFVKLATGILKGIIYIMLFIIMFSILITLIWRNPVFYLFGLESKSEFLERNNASGIQAGGIQPVIDYANERLPASAKILLLWEKRGYYLRRNYKEDSFGSTFARLMYEQGEPQKAAEELKKMGFTHILCDIYIPSRWFGSSYKDSEENMEAKKLGQAEYDFFQKMADNSMEMLTNNGSIYLFRIR